MNLMDDFVKLIIFDCGDTCGTIGIEPRCNCGKYLKRGKVFVNGLDEVKLTGWLCKQHGEIKPYYEFVDPADLIPA